MIEYLIKILLDGKEAEREAGRAGKAISDLDGTVMRVGKSILGMFAIDRMREAVVQTVEWADAINDAAKKVDITSERMQVFNLAAKQTGTDIGGITQSMKFLAQNMAEAVNKPTGDAAQAFGRLRVSLGEVKGLSVDTMFLLLSERMRTMPDSVQKTSDMINLLGRGAQELFPAMKEGFAGAAMAAKQLGAVVSTDDMEALEALKKKVAVIQVQMQAMLARGLGKSARGGGAGLDATIAALSYDGEPTGLFGGPMPESDSGLMIPLQMLSGLFARSVYGQDVADYSASISPAAGSRLEERQKTLQLVDLQKEVVEQMKGLRSDVRKAL